MHQNIFSSVILLICVISHVSSYFLTQDSLTCSSQAEKLSHTTANSILSSRSIKLSSFGDCSDPKNSYCTSLEKINCITICALIKYKTVSSSCNVTVTGGTEIGHYVEEYSHRDGFRVNIAAIPCHSDYIKANFRFVGKTQTGATQYEDTARNVYRLEGNHWNILYLTC